MTVCQLQTNLLLKRQLLIVKGPRLKIQEDKKKEKQHCLLPISDGNKFFLLSKLIVHVGGTYDLKVDNTISLHCQMIMMLDIKINQVKMLAWRLSSDLSKSVCHQNIP